MSMRRCVDYPKLVKSTKELVSRYNLVESEKSKLIQENLDESQIDDVVQVEDQQPKKVSEHYFKS